MGDGENQHAEQNGSADGGHQAHADVALQRIDFAEIVDEQRAPQPVGGEESRGRRHQIRDHELQLEQTCLFTMHEPGYPVLLAYRRLRF